MFKVLDLGHLVLEFVSANFIKSGDIRISSLLPWRVTPHRNWLQYRSSFWLNMSKRLYRRKTGSLYGRIEAHQKTQH